ncbi:DUF1629 domain-containing protein [Dokdonia sp.]|uniref:imm11 family protein n=1 Tax=Dokdonia sp. TaxID=2024995 RepID=UPI003267E749
MKKISYYHLNHSIEPKIVGNINDSEYNTQVDNFIDPENNDENRFDLYKGFNYYEHISKKLDLTKFKTHNKAKMTDCMSTRFFSTDGFFISDKLSKLLNRFDLENSQLLDCLITNKDQHHNYYLLSFLDAKDIFNYKKSIFGIVSGLDKVDKSIELKFNDSEELKNKKKELYFETNGENTITPLKIILTKNVDLFKSSIDKSILISERLKNDIEKNKITGFDFKNRKTQTEFYEDF